MKIMTLKEFENLQEKYNDIENLRIEMLMCVQKENNISNDIMDKLSYDVEFFETLEHSKPKGMYNLIKHILKENFEIEIIKFGVDYLMTNEYIRNHLLKINKIRAERLMKKREKSNEYLSNLIKFTMNGFYGLINIKPTIYEIMSQNLQMFILLNYKKLEVD